MRAIKVALGKMAANSRWEEFASAAPTMEQSPHALHNLHFPRAYRVEREVHAQMSPLEESYINRAVTTAGPSLPPGSLFN